MVPEAVGALVEQLAAGQRVQLQVRLTRRHEDGFELAGQGLVKGRSIISGLGCLATSVPLVEYVDPENMRVLFSEIYEPVAGL